MTIKASVSFSDIDYDLFNTVLECCKKNAEIRYADRQRHNIVGKSVFGTQNQSGINFQIILKDKPTGVEIYDYSKRGLDRKFADSLFNLLDNKTGNNVQHTTYLVTVSHENRRLFTETVHSHNGHILMEFVQSTIEPYRMNANFDTLSASYIADYSGPIKVIGNIFSPGNYTVSLEVTGVDFDNLFLPTPLKFEFPVSIYS